MFSNRTIVVLLLSLSTLFSASCVQNSEASRSPRQKQEGKRAPVSKVDRAFAAARAFANGKRPVREVRTEFERLGTEEVEALSEKQEGAAFFAVLMVMGLASEGSAAILETIINLDKPNPHDKLIAKGLIAELLRPKRPEGEASEDWLKLLEIVLVRYPEQINNLKRSNQGLDVPLLNRLVSVVDTAKIGPIIEKIDATNLDSAISWARNNGGSGKSSFNALYGKAPTAQRVMLRNGLAASCLADNTIGDLIDAIDDWGLGRLATDEYHLPSLTPGAFFSGTLLWVLARYAVDEDRRPGGIRRAPFLVFRDYAEKVKQRMGNAAYRAHITGTAPSITDLIVNALSPSHHENFANFYLAIEEPKDVFLATEKPEGVVTNSMIRELYDLIITDDAKADALASEPNPPGPRFVHSLLERTADANTSFLLDDFLTKAGRVRPEQAILNDAHGLNGKNPIQIIAKTAGRPAADVARHKAKMFERLLLNDGGAGVGMLCNADLTALTLQYFNARGPGGSGSEEFKRLYEKLNHDPDKQRFLRSELITHGATAGHEPLLMLLDDIVDNGWGLANGLENDKYRAFAYEGTLLRVLTKRAIAQAHDPQSLLNLRKYAQAIKSKLPAPYGAQISLGKAENNNEAIRAPLDTYLQGLNRQDFSDYYLANESVDNVYQAALRPENLVTNRMLRELYDLVIGDAHQAAHDLSDLPIHGAGNRFIHALMRRSADSDGNSYHILNKFLGSLYALAGGGVPGQTAERTELLKADVGGKRPFKLFVKQAPTDDEGKRLRIITRMLTYADAASVARVKARELERLVPILMREPAIFKKIYGFLTPTSAEASALRSKLLTENYGQGAARLRTFLLEVTGNANQWGLRDSIINTTHTYQFGGHAGPLLYVLTKKSIDDEAVRKGAHANLRKYATIIKAHFDSFAGNYNLYTSVTTFGAPPQTITNTLEAALTPSGRRFFANSFLAQESVRDVYEAAAEPQVLVTNALLRELYLAVVGRDSGKAASLANVGGSASGQDRFIHRLVRRMTDEEGYQILNFLLDDSSAGGVAELIQLNDTGGSHYPIKVLTDHTRPRGDEALSKVKMLKRLLAQDNGTAIAAVTANDLAAQRCFFGGGQEGQDLFVALYNHAQISLDPLKLRGLRSALLNEAFSKNETEQKNVVKAIAVDDNYGLRATVDTDEYDLIHDPEVPGAFHSGTLLAALTLRSIQTADGSTKKHETYRNLRSHAEAIRTAVETAPGRYVAYAQRAGSDAVATLKHELETNHFPTYRGLAEYYLDLDSHYAPLNADLVMVASTNKIAISLFEAKQLEWLYRKGIDDAVKAQDLANQLDGTGNRFIHNVLALEATKETYDVIKDYLDRITHAGNVADAEYVIATTNSHGRNCLQIAADNNRRKGGVASNKVISYLARHAANAEFVPLADKELVNVFSAIRDEGEPHDFELVFRKLDDLKMPTVAEFCAVLTVSVNKAALGTIQKDNLEDVAIRTAFQAEYGARAVLVQESLRNRLVKSAFEVGALDSPLKGALDRVAKLIERDFFDDATLKASHFNPFNDVGPSNLLFAALKKADVIRQLDQIENFVLVLRAKFANVHDWQLYLNDVNNPGGISTVDLLESIIRRYNPGRGAGADRNDAELWLSYN